MNISLRELTRRCVGRLNKRLTIQVEQHDVMFDELVAANFRTRALLKRVINQPIQLLFVCHERAFWGMFDSVYRAVAADPRFCATVVALPYWHPTLPAGEYKDDGVYDYLKEKGINVIQGCSKECNEWVNPVSLAPDYVLFQTPYPLFHTMWSVERVAMMAKVCYVPYGTTLFRGEVEAATHPMAFFRYVSLSFLESPFARNLFISRTKHEKSFDERKTLVTGHPKLDYLAEANESAGNAWKRGQRKDIKRILWAPRWCTSDRTCHFFDYKEYFFDFCQKHAEVDFVFRPHPLCLQNFLKTGEMTRAELEQMEVAYTDSANMSLDRTGDYQDTFLSSDLLVCDASSFLLEYLATGKPIVYTHRVDMFNELGRKVSRGCYWVKNAIQLGETLEMLISGNDPLREEREELMKELLFMPVGGAGLRIKEAIHSDFASPASGFPVSADAPSTLIACNASQ